MENVELQKIWKSVDTKLNQKSIAELNLLLASKANQTLNKFLVITSFSILSSLGLIIYLIITSLNRQSDWIYLSINISLGALALVAFLSGLFSRYKLQNNRFNLPLKDWLETKINMLSKWLFGKRSKLYIILIPMIALLLMLSIHVYFEYKTFLEVMATEESIIGLIVGFPIGLFVAFLTMRKIRRYQSANLEFLKDLYERLCEVR